MLPALVKGSRLRKVSSLTRNGARGGGCRGHGASFGRRDHLSSYIREAGSQEAALMELARLAERSSVDPRILHAARAITNDCDSRNDECELRAVYEAVKHGDARVEGLERGVRYVSDPVYADQFTAPNRLLAECALGACAEDCDGHAALVVSLCSALGFKAGLRAYGSKNSRGYSHVYAVAWLPKRQPTRIVGMDTTVPYARVGWQPPRGRVMTAIIGPRD